MKLLGKLLTLMLSSVWLGGAAWGAVAFDTSASATESGQDTSISVSISTSGANRLIDCAVHFTAAANTITGITHNGVALTQSAVGKITTNDYSVDVFRLVAPATGSQTVTATVSASGSNKILTCVAFTGADQTTPHGTGASYSGTGDPMTATITIPAGGMGVLFCTNNEEGGTFTPGGSQTEPFADLQDTDGNIRAMASYTSSTGSVAMTFSNGTGNYGACIALPINPAAAATRRAGAPMIF